MKFHLDTNIVEGTPEELVEYLRLLERKEKEEELLKSGHMHQPSEDNLKGSLVKGDSYTDSVELSTDEVETASTDIKVGDRVKVLDSKHGAEGEATVTKVLENGDVELAGTNKRGRYLTNWSNHVSKLEKIEAEEDKLMGYTFWYIDGVSLNHLNVLKTSIDGYFEDSKGCRYTHYAVRGLVKPIDNAYVREEFEDAKHNGKLLKYYPTLDEFAWK